MIRSLAALALGVLVCAGANAQQGAAVDSSFQARIDAAWDVARTYEGEASDSLWRALAAEPFAYYREHPDTPTGRSAVRTAFMMWGNADAADEVEAALPHLGQDSDVWPDVLNGIGNAYARSDRRDEYAALLDSLEGRLTHPRSRTALLATLGGRALSDGRDAEARPYFEAVVALDADSFQVARAQGQLYEIDHLALGMVAPDFEAVTLDGDTLRLADLRGQVVLLDFWATWCGPCLPELPHLAAAHQAHGSDGFQLVGVSLDTDRAELEAMVDERDLAWTHVWQDGKWDGGIARLYNLKGSGIPQTYLLDRDGRIVAKNVRKETLVEAVAELMGAPADGP